MAFQVGVPSTAMACAWNPAALASAAPAYGSLLGGLSDLVGARRVEVRPWLGDELDVERAPDGHHQRVAVGRQLVAGLGDRGPGQLGAVVAEHHGAGPVTADWATAGGPCCGGPTPRPSPAGPGQGGPRLAAAGTAKPNRRGPSTVAPWGPTAVPRRAGRARRRPAPRRPTRRS